MIFIMLFYYESSALPFLFTLKIAKKKSISFSDKSCKIEKAFIDSIEARWTLTDINVVYLKNNR